MVLADGVCPRVYKTQEYKMEVSCSELDIGLKQLEQLESELKKGDVNNDEILRCREYLSLAEICARDLTQQAKRLKELQTQWKAQLEREKQDYEALMQEYNDFVNEYVAD